MGQPERQSTNRLTAEHSHDGGRRVTMTARPAGASVAPWQWRVDARADGVLLLRVSGSWLMQHHLPRRVAIERELGARPTARALGFDTSALDDWDSGFVVFVRNVLEVGRAAQLSADVTGLPAGVRTLLQLATAVAERDTRRSARPAAIVARLGAAAIEAAGRAREMVTFLGDASLALARFATRRARLRRADLLVTIQEAGPEALGIISLISFLVGVILAYVSSVQLRQFGAEIYVADLVGIGIARQMGPIMAGVIMAGRTGAAYAAQLGTMRVNEEIDAVQTMGISPIEFLVLPRMLGLIVMMPVLTIYADLVGILGGAVVGVGMRNVGFLPYWNRTWSAVSLGDFAVGVVSASVFGVLVAIAGCLHGMQSGRSSAAVGQAATSAVVTGIVFIVTADAILTVIYDALGI
jgi:phospholipid/cholesterol/gamma-HCH transport system permease protein